MQKKYARISVFTNNTEKLKWQEEKNLEISVTKVIQDLCVETCKSTEKSLKL